MFLPLTRFLRFLLPPLLALSPSAPVAAADDAADAASIYRLLHGFFLAESGRHAEAAHIFAEVSRARQSAAIAERSVAAALRADNIGLARRQAARWLQYGGGVRASQTIAELALVSGDLAQAENVLTQLMRADAQSSADLQQQLRSIPDREEALAMGRRLFPQTTEGQLRLAQLAEQAGDVAAARAAINKALRYDARETEAVFFNAALTRRETDAPAAALKVLQDYVAGRCHDDVAHCVLPAVLSAYFGYLRHEDDWHAGLSAAVADARDWALRAGAVYEHWRMLPQAKAAYSRAPDSFRARMGLARIAEEEEGAAAALLLLRDAPAGDVEMLVARESAVARLLQKTEGAPAAVEYLRRAAQKVPNNFSLMYQMSVLLEQAGRAPEAVSMLEEIVRLYPHNPDGWNALGYVMADSGIRLQQAQKYIEHALALRPHDPNIIDSLGWVYYRLGELARAVHHLEKAAALSDAAEIAAHFGEVLWELGDTERAKRVWRGALARHPDNKVLNETLARYKPF